MVPKSQQQLIALKFRSPFSGWENSIWGTKTGSPGCTNCAKQHGKIHKNLQLYAPFSGWENSISGIMMDCSLTRPPRRFC